MKRISIAFVLAAGLCSIQAQTASSTPSPENPNLTLSSSRAKISKGESSDQLAAAKEDLAALRLKYKEQHPAVVDAKNRIAELERESAVRTFSGSGGGSFGRVGQSLHTIVRRGGSVPAGSIIVTTPMAQFKVDALSEDLAVLNFIFTREIEKTFGEKGTEYRLGVPITMRGERLVETSYLQDFGVLVKFQVPFAVVASGSAEIKTGPAAKPDSDWEKARRAVFGGSEDFHPAVAQTGLYDEKLVTALKRLIVDTLKSAANIRHLEENQSITVMVIGRPNTLTTEGERVSSPDPRSTILTVRVTKAQADAAMKDSENNDLAKQAVVVAYLDALNATAPSANSSFGGYGGGGAGMSGYGGYAPSSSK